MRKTFFFGFTLLAIAVVVLASLPSSPRTALTRIQDPSGEMVMPVELTPESSYEGRPGGNPLDVVDSSMTTDNFEGGFPAWTSLDLAFDPTTRWHLEPFHALSGDAFRCSNPLINCPAENGGYDNHWLQFLVFDAVSLVGRTNPQFAFSADWAVETPGGEPAPYDLWDSWNVWVSTDNGSTWSVLTPSTPAYTGQNSYAFGQEWGMGPGIAAYGGASGGHTQCIFPLTAYIGQSNVKLRIAFCSDPAFSSIDACATTWGLVVDSVRISDGATTLFSNDGVAGGWVGAPGPESPDVWVYEDSTSHSATHSWNGEQTAYYVNRAIKSYQVTLPAGYQKLKMTYWVWCDLPDFTGSGGTSLEDYYRIMVSTDDGATWTQSVYDYAYDNGEAAPGGNSLNGWVKRTRGLVSAAQTLDIPLFTGDGSAPQNVRVAFEVTLDGDDNGGSGSGLHVDDVEFIAQRAQAIDLATRNIVVPLPTTVGLSRPWTFEFVNEGLNALSPIRGKLRYTKPDGTFLPAAGDSLVVVAGVLNYGQSMTVNRIWPNPDMVGPWRLRVIANATGELDRTNDTTYSPATATNPDATMALFVRPAGVYELGYNRRAVSNAYLQERFNHFTPLADGVPAGDAANFDMLQLRIMWQYNELSAAGATSRISFYEEGPDSFHVGALIHQFTTEIDSSETIGAQGAVRWWTMDLSTIPALHNHNGNFWVAVAALDTVGPEADPTPLPLGTSPAGGAPDGHNYFGTAGGDLTQSAGRLLIDVVIGQAVEDVVIHRGALLSNDIILDWTAPPGASRYYVWRLSTPNQVYNTGTLLTPGGITTNTYTDVGRVPASTKDFYVVITEY